MRLRTYSRSERFLQFGMELFDIDLDLRGGDV